MAKLNILQELEKKERKANLLGEIDSLLPTETISIKADNIGSLFNCYDPSPLQDRELSYEVQEYILSQCKKIPAPTRIRLAIYLNAKENIDSKTIQDSINNFYKNKAKEQLYSNTKEHRKWIKNLIVGLICLGFCLTAAHILSLPQFEQLSFSKVLSESLGILGWVAIWEPAEFFLYGRKEISNELLNYMKMHKAQIDIIVK